VVSRYRCLLFSHRLYQHLLHHQSNAVPCHAPHAQCRQSISIHDSAKNLNAHHVSSRLRLSVMTSIR
jgi:hypothetical protein